jgi:aldehyde dehydrogenase (NAD+)
VIRARDADDALRLANAAGYGLSSAVFTRDTERGVRFALQVRAGMTHVNDSLVNDDAFGVRWAAGEFTTEHRVNVQRTPGGFQAFPG